MLFRKPKPGASGAGPLSGLIEFSVECRRTIFAAREEAVALGHEYVGTEHVLLALTNADVSDASALFAAFEIDPADLRREIEGVVQRGTTNREAKDLPFTSRTKKLLELAMRDAYERREKVVTSRHLFNGLLREEHGIAAQILLGRGVTLARFNALVATDGQARAFRVVIDDASSQSITEQIVSQIQEAIATGTLQAGERLPTVRRLADDLDVAPGTVARAYAELERLGVVITEGARGTRVAPRIGPTLAGDERREMLVGLLRPTAVAAFHLGATASEIRDALETAMRDIFPPDTGAGPEG